MKKRSFLTIVLSFACLLCLTLGVTLFSADQGVKAYTITGDSTQTVETFRMEGAQVRVTGESGLRFIASIDKDEFDALAAYYDEVEMGMLVIPKNKLTGALDLSNTTDPIRKVSSLQDGGVIAENEDKYEFRAVLYNIPEDSFGRDIQARAYLTITFGANEKTFYADAMTRNIAYVSYMVTEVLTDSPFYKQANDTLAAYIGERQFKKLELPEGVSCDYLYTYEGQSVDLTVEGDAELDLGGASYTHSGDVYTVETGAAGVTVTIKQQLGSFEALAANETFAIGALSGNVTAITDGFSYSAGVLTGNKAGGEYEVAITTDAGYTYELTALVITEKITTAEGLAAFASRTNNGYYVLGTNIDASGYELMNIGASFDGTFDGRGYSIVNGTFISPNDNNTSGGLFGTINSGATVKNLALTNATLQSEYSWSSCSPFTGNGRCHGTIKNVYVEISSVGVKNGAYNNTYTPSKAMGLCGHADDGSVIDNVIVKSAATLNYNVCDMVLGNAKITNTYVIGGSATNNGWNQNSSPVSITKVSSLSAAQQASFDASIWDFENGMPSFKVKSIAYNATLFLDQADGGKTVSLTEDLGIASGTVASVKVDGEDVTFAQSGATVTVNAPAGNHTVMFAIGDKKYCFAATVITQRIDNAAELAAFASRSNNGYYVLGGNVNASGYEFMNIGATFDGTFDGQGYAIRNATVISPNDNNTSGGLFGTINPGATVKNFALTNATLQSEYSWSSCSPLTGNAYNKGTIENVYIEIAALGVKNGAYNNNYTPSTAMGLCGHADGGSVIDHVIVKSAATLNYNVCQMVLGNAKITNTYVIGGGSTNNGWKQDSSSVISITKVSSLSAEQQSSFDADIWLFVDGMPSFVKALDFSAAIDTGKTFTVDASNNTITLADLGVQGTLVALYNDDNQAVGENLTSSSVDVTSGALGERETLYAFVSGNLYSFEVFTVTEVIDNAAELAAFASRSNNGYYILSGNVDASGYEFMNIGATFDGTFDGQGYAIDNGTFISPNDNNTSGGLFGTINPGATVKNFALTNATLQSEYSWSSCSPLTGNAYNKGTIENVYIEIAALGVKNGAYNNNYTPSTAMGLCGHADSGSVIDHVIVKSAATLNYNVCQMVLGNAKITNTYVIGGGSTNNGWKQDSSSVISITKVSSLSAAQQSSFDPEIWTFIDGMPKFTKTLADLSNATALNVAAPTVYASADDGSQKVTFAALGIPSGTVNNVYADDRMPMGFTYDGTGFAPSGLKGGLQTLYVDVDGNLYSFPVVCVTKILRTASDLTAFVASHERDGYYLLGNDIDASAVDLNAATITGDGTGFSGIFDGQSHAIDGAYVVNGGLLGGISTGGVVKNLAFTNTEYGFSGPGSAFCHTNYGTIENCYIQVVKQGQSGRGGSQQTYCALSAFADCNYGTIAYCVSDLPEFGTSEHKAVCEYNYAVLRDVYCAGSETATYYNLGNAYSVTNVVSKGFYDSYALPNWTLPDENTTGFDSDYWSFTTFHLPLFKGTQSAALTVGGVAQYTIIRGSDSIAVEAANELQKYFKAATGATLSIYDMSEYATALNEAPHYISVGSTYQLHNSGLWAAIGSGISGEDEYDLGTSGYAIDTIDGNVYITGFYKGSDLHGTLNGVYGWLNRQFGLELYAADEYAIRTGCTNESLALVDVVVVPDINALVGGNVDSYGNKSLGYYSTNGANGLVTGAYGNGNIQPVHNFLDFLPQNPSQSAESNPHGVPVDENYGSTLGTAPKKNFNDGYTYYWDNAYGNRNVYDICLAQNEANVIPKLLDRMATLTAWVGAKHQKYICFSHEDGSFWCPHCRKKFEQGNTGYASEREYITMTYARFMIRLANAMKADSRFDGMALVMLHYGLSSAMPASGSAGNYTLDANIASYMAANGLTLPDNLAVMICYSLSNNYGTASAYTPISNDIDLSAVTDTVNRYRTITNKFMVWTYYENFQNYFAPFDAMNQVQANMQFAESIGAEYYYPQGMSNVGSVSIDWGALENYVISKLRWNVNADVNTLINNFFICYYGSASTQMKALYDSYIEKISRLHNFNGYGYGYGGTVNKVSGAQYEYISTGCWSKDELEGFLDRIDAAKAALKADYDSGAMPIGRYNQLLSRVKIEELTFKYMYIKLYTSAAVTRFGAASATALKNTFVSECTALGVTNWNEGEAVSTSMF